MTAQPKWLMDALVSLDFFENNPEYYKEFKHEYFVDRCRVTRQTLHRNETYMKRYREVKEKLKKADNPAAHRSTGLDAMKQRNAELREELAAKEAELATLKLRLNECYLMMEDHGIDPEFIYPQRRKKHKQL